MATTSTLEQLHEYMLVTEFGGGVPCPTVQTLPQVDVEALTTGDDDPLFVTLQISEVGRTSKNGVIYDEYLVGEIESAIREGGIQALMGHLTIDEMDSAFPHSDSGTTPLAGFWVGVMRAGEVLWGKAYIPKGKVREYIRQLKATGGKLGVSFFGTAVVEQEGEARRLRQFTLDTLDFAPPTRASLELAGTFDVTREFENKQDEGGDMPTEINSINDVPQSIREQIERQALVNAQASENAQRVQELEQQVQTQEATIQEFRDYGRIVTEISAQVGEGVDIVDWVREMNESMTRLGELLGADVNIVTRIEEYHVQFQEMAQERFENAVNSAVAEFTSDWVVSTDDAKSKVANFHKDFKQSILAEFGDNHDHNRVAEVAQAVWDDGKQGIAESVKLALMGPSALVNSQQKNTSGIRELVGSAEKRSELKSKYNIRT